MSYLCSIKNHPEQAAFGGNTNLGPVHHLMLNISSTWGSWGAWGRDRWGGTPWGTSHSTAGPLHSGTQHTSPRWDHHPCCSLLLPLVPSGAWGSAPATSRSPGHARTVCSSHSALLALSLRGFPGFPKLLVHSPGVSWWIVVVSGCSRGCWAGVKAAQGKSELIWQQHLPACCGGI